MPPHRASSAENEHTPAHIAAAIDAFFSQHAEAAVLEDGRVLFDMRTAKFSLSTEHNRCTLQLWSGERNLVRRIASVEARSGALRLATLRLGHAQTRLLELVSSRERRTPTTRETARSRYVKTLERVLTRSFPDRTATGFRSAMDLERSFGPAYARGSLVRGQKAWAVIAVNTNESSTIVDGILTLGVLWLHHCRSQSSGRRLYEALLVIVPRGMTELTRSRMAWMNQDVAQWMLYELDERDEELTAVDVRNVGNLRTRLVRHPDESAARERFADAIERVLSLVPAGEASRVETKLRSTTELGFLLHGLEFARARVSLAANSFSHVVEITVGAAGNETPLTSATAASLSTVVAELFSRRKADAPAGASDPLFRAAPERWLESMLRADLAPLTRSLAPTDAPEGAVSRVIPRFDNRHVYTQVPAIAGSKDRALLDLLGVTADGRLAVIELKADDDLHLALQGLDYWIRVRHHHRQPADAASGLGEFQRKGYFCDIELSPEDPRLYLAAPALHIHPATETVLRYISPRVEWHLLALDERWRSGVAVVWRRRR